MNKHICFFIGHRDASPELLPLLVHAIEKHITEHDVTTFLVGHYGAFDRLASKALISVKNSNPHIELILLSPYHPAEKAIELPDGFNGILYPFISAPPKKYAIIKANRYAVSHSEYIIAYLRYSTGNTQKLLDYAQRKKQSKLKKITLINRIELK